MGTVRWLQRWHRFWRVVRDWELAWRLVDDDGAREAQLQRLRESLDWSQRLSLRHALDMADHYGITLHNGKAGFACRAELPKDRWEHDISPDADEWSYSDWLIAQPEDVTAISSWSEWPEISIYQCIVKAKKAGVI